jgi:hypothetical protein
MSDLQPDLDEVQQAEEHGVNTEAPVEVAVTGVVRTQALPEKQGSTKTVACAAAASAAVTGPPVRVLSHDHRRARVVLLAVGGAMRVAFNTASKESPATMALWPANVVFTHLGDDEVWVAADTTAITVSVVGGNWAVGEDGGS